MKPLIEKLIAAYDAIVSKFGWPQDVLLLLTRIAWGFAFFQAGWGKFGRLEDVGQFFADLVSTDESLTSILARLSRMLPFYFMMNPGAVELRKGNRRNYSSVMGTRKSSAPLATCRDPRFCSLSNAED